MHGYEAQFLPPYQGDDEEPIEHGYSDAFSHLLDNVAEHITGREGSNAVLTRDETDQLMFKIIAGEDAQRQIDTTGPSEVLNQCAQTGLAAKKQILEGTARLGRRIGINSMGYQFDTAWKPTGYAPGLSGGLAKIANLSSRYADVEDRIQNAFVGLPLALQRYAKSFREAMASENPEEALAALPGFGSVVMYASRESIYLHMSHPTIREPMGARILYDDLLKIWEARKLYRLFDLNLVTRDQVATKEAYKELQELQDMIAASHHVPWDDVIFPDGAPEETLPYELDKSGEGMLIFAAYEFESEPPEPLYLEEVYPDPHWRDGFTAVETAITWLDPKQGLLHKHPRLTDRERNVLLLLCGFLSDTYASYEIALLLETKKQSVFKSKKDAVGKLRHNKRAMALLENLSWVNGDEGTVARAFTGERIRTGHRIVKPAIKPPAAHAAAPAPWWVRRVQELPPEAETSKRGSRAFQEVYRALTKGIFSALEELSVSAEEAKRSPYPKTLYDQIETYLGTHVTVKHIEDFWNNQAPVLLNLQREGGTPVNANRLGQLTSKLLANRLQSGDKVRLYIPEGKDGQCGYLGAWISQGEIKIVGNPGDFVGFGMNGSGAITVDGSAGDYAGAYGSGGSSLEVSENAGRQAGYKLRHRSSVCVRENALLPVATGIRDAGFVQVGEFTWGDPETPDALEPVTPPTEKAPPPLQSKPAAARAQPPTSPPKPAARRRRVQPHAPPTPAQRARPTTPSTPSLPKQPDDTPPPLWAYRTQDLTPQKGPARPNTRSYKLVAEALKEAVISGVDQLTIPDDATDSLYPEQLYNEITRHLGAYLTSQHIEGFWNREVPHLIGNRRWNRKLQLNPNRLGQLVSKLLADRLGEEDQVKFVIPEGAEGQCGYLGAWATRGVITIIGEAGDYTGAYLSGTALVAVEGDVGDYAGMEARGESYFVVDGQAGNFLGYMAHGLSTIAVQEAAGESVAVAIADQANVVVKDVEWLPLYGVEPRSIVPEGTYEEEEQEITPASEVAIKAEEEPMPEPEPELEPESESESEETPSSEAPAVAQKEQVSTATDEEPDKAEELIRSHIEIISVEEVSPSPSPASTPPKPRHQSTVQTIDFEDAAYYLHLDGPDALQEYTDQMGHKGQEPLTAEELAKLRHRFPELS